MLILLIRERAEEHSSPKEYWVPWHECTEWPRLENQDGGVFPALAETSPWEDEGCWDGAGMQQALERPFSQEGRHAYE